VDGLPGLANGSGKPVEHREGMGLGMMRKPTDEEDNHFLIPNPQGLSLLGTLLGRRWPKPVGIYAEWDVNKT
jgi:hypothetical protein